MHVVGMKIAGFKSFVDPVDVPIEPGLTGIVGPNGCGKSNLLEALRWVMGAVSAKAMRGGEMDDLIFSGTDMRPSRELAEVTVLLDNSMRTAPAEYNDNDMLEVRRALRRGAGSSFSINGRTVRARDVQLLFADASTGANSPSLVRQGQISELISSKPQNRRKILEEAAGIGGLAARRHAAELKLKAAQENLDRVGEVMAEVERQANALKRRAGKARRYRALSDEIAAFEARLSAVRWRSAVDEAADARKAIEEARREEHDAASEAGRTVTAELKARELIDPLRHAETEAAGKLGVQKLQQAKLESERTAATEALQRLGQDIVRHEVEHARLTEEASEARQRAETASAALDELPAESPEAQREAEDALASALQVARTRREHLESDLDQRRQARARAEAAADAARQRVDLEAERLDRTEKELSRIAVDLGALDDLEALATRLTSARERHASADTAATEAQSALATANARAEAARKEETRLTPPLQAAEQRVREIEAELAALERLLRTDSGERHTPVAEAIDPRGLDRALAAALDADLDASENAAATAYWTMRATSALAALPEGAQPLSQAIEAPPVLAARLSQVGLVDRADGERLQSQLKQGQRLVSREGDLWRWDGFVRTHQAALTASERLANHARRKALKSEFRTANEQLQKAAAERAKASETLTAAELDVMERRRRLPDLMRAANEAREALMRAEQEHDRHELKAGALRETHARLTADRDERNANVQAARAALNAAPTVGDSADLDERAARLADAREEERNAIAALDAFRRDRERNALQRRNLTRERDDWTARETQVTTRLQASARDLASARDAYASAETRPPEIQSRLDELATGIEAAERARQSAADRLAEAEAKLREAEFAARAGRDRSATARESLVRAEARLEAAQRRETEIAEAVQSAFDRPLEELEALVAEADAHDADENQQPPASAAEMDARLADLRRQRDQLGAVNMEADEQLTEITGRIGLQVEERDDLIAAIARLREGVDALNEEGRARLLEAYKSVNAHFTSLFTSLFEGGHAELRLTESDDPLDAGLEIFASPPGKRLGTLSLMSGGEQALTATALIFAVFLSRPAPICVLDEVDAPLDDANVDRFCRLLDEMRKRTRTRFIVITHNAVSMSRMDRLLGVTMQEPGVSRLVSVDLEAAERLAAA